MDRAAQRALERLQSMPVAAFFDFQFGERDDERATVSAPTADRFLQVEDVVHGGVLSTLADTAAVYLILPTLTDGHAMTSIEFKLNFLRPARAGLGDVEAVATMVKRGRTVAVSSVDVSQGGELCATGLFTYLIWKP
ncbi:MAG: PaaI family thioesterase [Gemmatimonadota bacterium]